MLLPLCQTYCMWCGSFSTSGPTVAVFTTLPYADEPLVASTTAKKSGPIRSFWPIRSGPIVLGSVGQLGAALVEHVVVAGPDHEVLAA